MHFKLKVQKLETVHLCLYFKIKPVNAKLKCFSLKYLKKQTNEKNIQRLLTKTENGALHFIPWYTNLN